MTYPDDRTRVAADEASSLADRLRTEPRLDARLAATIAAGAADALAARHARGQIHGDVRPARIAVRADGEATLLDPEPASTVEQAAPGPGGGATAFGSPDYMAPEQLAGAPPTRESDVHALGAVIYQMLAGRPPFQAPTPLRLAREQRVAPARIYGKPQALVDLSLAALSRDPAERPSAVRLAASLRTWLDGGYDPAAPRAVRAIPLMPVGRRRGRRAAAVGLASVGLALAVMAAFALVPASTPIVGELSSPTLDTATEPPASPIPVVPAAVPPVQPANAAGDDRGTNDDGANDGRGGNDRGGNDDKKDKDDGDKDDDDKDDKDEKKKKDKKDRGRGRGPGGGNR